jgi:hypothetical protein
MGLHVPQCDLLEVDGRIVARGVSPIVTRSILNPLRGVRAIDVSTLAGGRQRSSSR